MALRCTQKLLSRLKAKPGLDSTVATTLLGHWYANLIYIGRQQLILCVSEKSFLPVLLAAKDLPTMPTRLLNGAAWMLTKIGVPELAMQHELAAMHGFVIGRTQSRQVLGVMNEMVIYISFMMSDEPGRPYEAYMAELADTIYSPIGYKSPAEVARELFNLSLR